MCSYDYMFHIPIEDDDILICKALLVTNTIDPDDWEVEDFYYLEDNNWYILRKGDKYYDTVKEKFESFDEWDINYEWDRNKDL